MNTDQSEQAPAERLLRRSKTLAKLACVSSEGPPFRLAGRFPLYPTSGLDTWAQSKIGPLIRSTSEVRRGS